MHPICILKCSPPCGFCTPLLQNPRDGPASATPYLWLGRNLNKSCVVCFWNTIGCSASDLKFSAGYQLIESTAHTMMKKHDFASQLQ